MVVRHEKGTGDVMSKNTLNMDCAKYVFGCFCQNQDFFNQIE